MIKSAMPLLLMMFLNLSFESLWAQAPSRDLSKHKEHKVLFNGAVIYEGNEAIMDTLVSIRMSRSFEAYQIEVILANKGRQKLGKVFNSVEEFNAFDLNKWLYHGNRLLVENDRLIIVALSRAVKDGCGYMIYYKPRNP